MRGELFLAAKECDKKLAKIDLQKIGVFLSFVTHNPISANLLIA